MAGMTTPTGTPGTTPHDPAKTAAYLAAPIKLVHDGSPWQIDNRWSPGVAATAPDNAPAAYSARWIDNDTRASIVPDRQGFAYSTDIERGRLINLLQDARLHTRTGSLAYDVVTMMYGADGDVWKAWLVRRGGYVYVDAWLKGEPSADDLPADWWRDHDAMVTLTAYMAEHGHDGKAIAHAVEKPWKYGDEYALALVWAAE